MGTTEVYRAAAALVRAGLPRAEVIDRLRREHAVTREEAEGAWESAAAWEEARVTPPEDDH